MPQFPHFKIIETVLYNSSEDEIRNAALFIIARTWKQPRCPSADEWIRKLWYINTVE